MIKPDELKQSRLHSFHARSRLKNKERRSHNQNPQTRTTEARGAQNPTKNHRIRLTAETRRAQRSMVKAVLGVRMALSAWSALHSGAFHLFFCTQERLSKDPSKAAGKRTHSKGLATFTCRFLYWISAIFAPLRFKCLWLQLLRMWLILRNSNHSSGLLEASHNL